MTTTLCGRSAREVTLTSASGPASGAAELMPVMSLEWLQAAMPRTRKLRVVRDRTFFMTFFSSSLSSGKLGGLRKSRCLPFRDAAESTEHQQRCLAARVRLIVDTQRNTPGFSYPTQFTARKRRRKKSHEKG